MLSRKAKYALTAMLHLARHHRRGPRLISEIAEAEALPKKFLELILLELKNAGYLDSKKGRGGGYVLAMDPEKIPVGGIVRTIDGPLAPLRCASLTAPVMCDDCPDPATCGIRLVMKDARDAISDVLDGTTLQDVLDRTDEQRRAKDGNMFYI
ncbi:Rrf2 family transcriptional regulator [bacterium]|nr:Rrf2 family transcriptional regulator [bacterium]